MDFTLCLTHDCNLRCAYCYAGAKMPRRMSWDTSRQAIDFCLDQSLRHASLSGAAPRAQLGFFGGEPLLEWDLLQRAAVYADERSGSAGIALRKTVTTNMVLLDEVRSDWLRRHGFYLGLSLDGNAAMQDLLRKWPDGRGSHAAAAAALRFYRGADPGAEVILVVDPRNVLHLADSVAWLLEEDIRNIALNPNFYIEWPAPALDAWRAGCERVAELYMDCYRRGVPVRLNVIDGKIMARIQGGYAECDRCGFGEHEIAVAASGNLYPCERLVGDDTNAEMRIGNVFDGFDRERRREVLACRGNREPECESCSVKDRCMNWCGCINYATTGLANRVDGRICYHERMVIEVADRVGSTLFEERNPAFLAKFYGVNGNGQ